MNIDKIICQLKTVTYVGTTISMCLTLLEACAFEYFNDKLLFVQICNNVC